MPIEDLLHRRVQAIALGQKVEVRVIPRDLSNPIAPASLFDECGEIDFLVNNAGFGSLGTFVESDPAMLGEMLQVNVAALTQLTRLFLPTMLERRSGRIAARSSLRSHPARAVRALGGARGRHQRLSP